MELRTERLLLRHWREADLLALAELTSDPVVMANFPGLLDRAESDAFAARMQSYIETHGFGFLVAEVTDVAPFVGIIGLALMGDQYPFGPAIEIGWRLSHAHWGQGYAVEGARACLAHAFGPLDRDEVVAITGPANLRSQRVMRSIGMTRDEAGDFDHPRIAPTHPMRRMLLYGIRKVRPGATPPGPRRFYSCDAANS